MKWFFWVALIAGFVLVNEYLSKWFLAIAVGELDMGAAYDATFRYASFSSYLFTAAFRGIPYAALAVLAAKSVLSSSPAGRIALWLMLLALAALHFYGYWEMQHSLFTDARGSSTASLAVIAIPMWALIFGAAGYALFCSLAKIVSYFCQQWFL